MNTSSKRILGKVVLAVLLSQLAPLVVAAKDPPLDKRHSEWLDLVDAIITPIERKTFKELSDDSSRDAFINLFWRLRDPSKGTPQNEFKDEHLRRVAHADRYFRGSPIPGRKSDRGRIYIILGPPLNQNEILRQGLAPTLIWDYQESAGRGLPTAFNIVFYKRRDNDDYKLYIPAVDGPAALLRAGIGTVDSADYASVYEKIHEIDSQVAEVSLSLIPGETPFRFTPSMADQLLIRNIYELPARALNVSYARHFENYQSLVDVNVTTNYIESAAELLVAYEPRLGLRLLHVALRPERLSVDYSEEQKKYYFAFKLRLLLKQGEKTVMEHSRDYPLYLTKEELEGPFSAGVVISDAVPVAPGEYRLTALLQNAVNNEISYVERNISVPVPGGAALSGPIVSYQTAGTPLQNFTPFAVADRPLKIEPLRQFGLRDPLYVSFWADGLAAEAGVKAELEVKSIDSQRPWQRLYELPVAADDGWASFSQRLEGLGAGNYSAEARLRSSDGHLLGSGTCEFSVSMQPNVPHPPIVNRSIAPANRFIYYTMQANLLDGIGKQEGAAAFYERALAINPGQPITIKAYAELLLKTKRGDRALTVIEPLAARPEERFHYLVLKGRALFQLERWQEAIDTLQGAARMNDSDPTVLYTIGISYLKAGDRNEALRALRALLKVSPQRQDVADLVSRIEKE